MNDATPAQATQLRAELDELKLRVDALDARVAAAELKQQADVEAIHEQLTRLAQDIAALKSGVGNVESLMRANHMAQVHLWGVTARLLKLEEKEIRKAQRKAEKALEVVR